MLKVIGVFGNGHWSKTIQSKLATYGPDKIRIAFIADSKADYLSNLDEFGLDWAVVASTNTTHYEIVETCLQKGISVFCEKPLVSHPAEVNELYELAKSKKALLYVDDVFMWRNDIKEFLRRPQQSLPIKATWLKPEGIINPRQCLNDLLYHHLYLLGESVKFTNDASITATIKGDQLHVTVSCGAQYLFNVNYGLNHIEREHKYDNLDLGTMPNDALQDMFDNLFAHTVDISGNRRRTIWATKMLYEAKRQVMPSIGVIGGGIFGCTAALLLANEGCDVTIYQKTQDIIQGASAKNQLRVHRGYHYPRSIETALAAKHSEAKFKSYFRAAVDDTNRHLYAIAKHGSLTSAPEFEQFLDAINLNYIKLGEHDPSYKLFRKDVITGIYEVQESLYDPLTLRNILKSKFSKAGVKAKFKRDVYVDELQGKHDYIITATYANPLSSDQRYQFEVCEKPVVRLPDEFKKTSILILDGPFMGIDPVPFTEHHLLDSVKDAIHHTNIGRRTEIPEYLEPYMEMGLIKHPKKSRYDLFVKKGQSFYKNFNPLEYLGSYFVVRAVLPYRDHDDARPSIIRQIDKNCYEVFSGKVSTAPHVAQKFVEGLLYSNGRL